MQAQVAKDRDDFVERTTRFIMPDNDPAFMEQVRASETLEGIYTGGSSRIHNLIRLAYARGCRKGAGAVWDAHQRIDTAGG